MHYDNTASSHQDAFLAPLRFGHDLHEEIMRVVRERTVTHAVFSVIGAVSSAAFGYYDQPAKKYLKIEHAGCLEVISCTGNVTLKDGAPFAHAHVLFGDRSGAAFGGHLMSPSIVFAAELHLQRLDGPPPERALDARTGLHLWPAGNAAGQT